MHYVEKLSDLDFFIKTRFVLLIEVNYNYFVKQNKTHKLKKLLYYFKHFFFIINYNNVEI